MLKPLSTTNQYSNMKYLKTLWLGVLAGLAIGLGSFLYLLFRFLIPGQSGLMFGSMIFSVGLILVCAFSLNLYTGKIGIFLDVREKIKENSINLPIILLGNAIGAFGLGIICHFIFMNWADFANSFSGEHSITVAKCSSNTVFIQGILCGALVYIAVYCYKNFENWAMKIIGIIVSVTLFVYCGFQHCIANMFYFAIEFNWNIDILWNLLIVILTNSVGALLVRCLVHLAAIVMPKKEER